MGSKEPRREFVRGRRRFRDCPCNISDCRPRFGADHEETVQLESGPAVVDARIREVGGWPGAVLAKVRAIIHKADPEIVEEWKCVKAISPGGAVFSRTSFAGEIPRTGKKNAGSRDDAL